MTSETLDLPGSNPYRSKNPVRQLDAEDLGITMPDTPEKEQTEIWEELQDLVETNPTNEIIVGVATADEITTTATGLREGPDSVHAIELAVWKAYSETQSPITHVLIKGTDEEFNPCGRCLQTILDYSDEALIRITGPNEDDFRAFSLDQPSLLKEINEPTEEKPDQVETDEEDESMSVPENPPFIDFVPSGDEVLEYIRLNAPVYHLKYQSHHQTFCGTDLTNRETVSSTEEPTLLDPCKRCHGKTNIETVEEQRIRLRSQLAEKVEDVREVEEEADTFTEGEIDAILGRLAIKVPDTPNAGTLRNKLSEAIVDVHDAQENPLTFSRAEMEALEGALNGEGIIPNSPHLLASTSTGRIGRIALSDLNQQRRAGKGSLSLSLEDDESPVTTFSMNPRETLYIFTNLGQIHQVDAHRVPVVNPGDEPKALSEIVKLNEDETLKAAFACRDIMSSGYVILGTRDGNIKRTSTEEFENILRGGIRVIELEGDDEIRGACLMDEGENILMTTRGGRSIRFEGADARPMGRNARGVAGIELDRGDEVVAVNAVDPANSPKVLTVTSNGYGKRSSIEEYRVQTRNGRGLIDISTGDRNGGVVAVETISKEGEKFVTMSKAGYSLRTAVDEVSILSRNTKGVEIMDLNSDDELSNLALFE